VNPFSFALGRRPPEGGAVWFDPNNNVNQFNHFPIEMMIGRPDLLMVQNSMDAETADIKAIFCKLSRSADERLWACSQQRILVPISQES
jgi:hypothetical protein